MHGVPSERVVVTGAQCFDRWFDRQPSRGRADFARHVGLPDDRPFVLWVCSALFPGSPSEAEFVMRWAAHPPLVGRCAAARCGESSSVRIRPARVNGMTSTWRAVPGVAFRGGNPVDDESRADYFDSLYHSAAVVGLNTSAFIEAGIAERPVLAILPPEFSASQEGTLHFRYLIEGGLLTTARSLEEHAVQLSTMLEAVPAAVLRRQQEFVRAFVRPCGLDVPATRVMADALESLAAAGPAEHPPAGAARRQARVRRIACDRSACLPADGCFSTSAKCMRRIGDARMRRAALQESLDEDSVFRAALLLPAAVRSVDR